MKNDVSRETVILGGGLAGISAAYYLKGDCTVLEANEKPGGLCQSFRDRKSVV